jgi:phage replication O-like protein O
MNKNSPQLKDGYTRIAHQILIDLASYRINGQERQILDVIFYKTYGFHKKKDWISLTQFQELTGMKKSGIVRAIKGLIYKNIVIKEDNGKVVTYGYNKVKATWKPLSKKITYNKPLSKKIIALSKKITPIIKEDKNRYHGRVLHKIQDNITKDTYTKDNRHYSKIDDLLESDLEEIANLYKVPISFVISKREDMFLWANEKMGRGKGRNWKLTLMNWVKRDALKITQDHYDKQISQNKYGVTRVSKD